MIINRRIDGITTMTRLFVYKIVVLNNIFPSMYTVLGVVEEKRKNGKDFCILL